MDTAKGLLDKRPAIRPGQPLLPRLHIPPAAQFIPAVKKKIPRSTTVGDSQRSQRPMPEMIADHRGQIHIRKDIHIHEYERRSIEEWPGLFQSTTRLQHLRRFIADGEP